MTPWRGGLVVSLCDRTGVMVQPWADAGYHCLIVDTQHRPGGVQARGWPSGYSVTCHQNILSLGDDVRGFQLLDGPIAAVFAFPPCTNLSVSGARWFEDKGLEALHESLGLVIACKRICEASGAPWLLENPVGMLSSYWRRPDYMFQPWQYGDAYAKKTCLWTGGGFVMPAAWQRTKPDVLAPMIHMMPPSADRGDKRSVTPDGFARAVFESNEPLVRVRVA